MVGTTGLGELPFFPSRGDGRLLANRGIRDRADRRARPIPGSGASEPKSLHLRQEAGVNDEREPTAYSFGPERIRLLSHGGAHTLSGSNGPILANASKGGTDGLE